MNDRLVDLLADMLTLSSLQQLLDPDTTTGAENYWARIRAEPRPPPPPVSRPLAWRCQRCRCACGTKTRPMYGFPGLEPLVCLGCWYATHDCYPADGREIPPDPLAQR